MFNIALYQPEIPPNTGNIIRLAANSSCALHLIHPLGFSMDEAKLRRAGLDYKQLANVQHHADEQAFFQSLKPKQRVFAFSTKANKLYTEVNYQFGDVLLFGPETRGLPEDLMHKLGHNNLLTLPMTPNSRSLNLSNSVAIAVYEAWRQLDFKLPASQLL